MLVVKDAMVLIHLAKLTLLSTACAHFGAVAIPASVHEETVIAGREHGYPDAEVIAETVSDGRIDVVEVTESRLVERAENYNLQGGEAAAVALYWERNADLLASDDDNVRRKRTVLDLDLIGTPSILVELFDVAAIDSDKLRHALDELREIGWFSTAVLDKIALETGVS